MKKSLLFGAGRGPRLAVLELIKRSGEGRSVQDLAMELKMSYMGVKAHCLALESSGHLMTWRESSSKGRPRLLYRLAELGEKLFANTDLPIALCLLKEAAVLYGPSAPQKLLLMYFRTLRSQYSQLINSETPSEWPRALAQLRDKEGRMAVFRKSETSWEIRESHNPLASIMREYPEVKALEENMISEVLGLAVRRREEGEKSIFSP